MDAAGCACVVHSRSHFLLLHSHTINIFTLRLRNQSQKEQMNNARPLGIELSAARQLQSKVMLNGHLFRFCGRTSHGAPVTHTPPFPTTPCRDASSRHPPTPAGEENKNICQNTDSSIARQGGTHCTQGGRDSGPGGSGGGQLESCLRQRLPRWRPLKKTFLKVRHQQGSGCGKNESTHTRGAGSCSYLWGGRKEKLEVS